MFHQKALLMENRALAPGYHYLRLLTPEIAQAARAGQFIQINLAHTGMTDPLLPRPISIFNIDNVNCSIELIYKVVGRGTTLLSGKNRGETLEITGPVGNGFTVPDETDVVALVAGGVGMPPLYCLANQLKASRPGLSIVLFYGGRTENDLLELERWSQLGAEIVLVTDDGSIGEKGLVTTAFDTMAEKRKFDYLAACGPKPMLRAVQQLALARGITGELSLESHMACGIGACLGCVCRTKQGYRRVCIDGPVFPIGEVSLDE